MEQLRTYTLADLTRITRSWDRKKLPLSPSTLSLHRREIKRNPDIQKSASRIADGMYEIHKDWVEKKLEPVMPYLQGTNDTKHTQKLLSDHFKLGLKEAISIHTLSNKEFEIQDVVAGYATGFICMLRSCKDLGINPNYSALWLAQYSHSIEKKAVVKIFKENPELPKIVLERAALSPNPNKFLEEYRNASERKVIYPLIRQKIEFSGEYEWYTEQIRKNDERKYLNNDGESGSPFSWIKRRVDIAKLKGEQIVGVPFIRQQHKNWCGYTSLAMVLQYYGYNISPENIFTHLMGDYDRTLEEISPSRAPSISALAATVEELTPLKARVLMEKDFEAIKERNPSLSTPIDVLNSYIKGKVPCIIRIPGHFKVVNGVNKEIDRYTVTDPLLGVVEEKGRYLEGGWSAHEENYTHNSRYLMLAISRPKPTAKKSS